MWALVVFSLLWSWERTRTAIAPVPLRECILLWEECSCLSFLWVRLRHLCRTLVNFTEPFVHPLFWICTAVCGPGIPYNFPFWITTILAGPISFFIAACISPRASTFHFFTFSPGCILGFWFGVGSVCCCRFLLGWMASRFLHGICPEPNGLLLTTDV